MSLFLSTCAKKLHCLFTIFFINCLSVWALLGIFPFVTFFVQEIFIVLCESYICPPPLVAFSLLHFLSMFHIHTALYPYIPLDKSKMYANKLVVKIRMHTIFISHSWSFLTKNLSIANEQIVVFSGNYQ